MEQLAKSISVDMSAINTNHSTFNAVLNQRFHAAKEKKIPMLFQIGDVPEIRLTEEHLGELFGGGFEDAIPHIRIIATPEEQKRMHSNSSDRSAHLLYRKSVCRL